MQVKAFTDVEHAGQSVHRFWGTVAGSGTRLVSVGERGSEGFWDAERRMAPMSRPLSSGRPGKSEFSHGDGAFADPRSDAQTARGLIFGVGEDSRDAQRDYRAQKRLDATNPEENVEDMLYVLGNPDAFGPGPKLVTEKPVVSSGKYQQPKYRYGVNRQE